MTIYLLLLAINAIGMVMGFVAGIAQERKWQHDKQENVRIGIEEERRRRIADATHHPIPRFLRPQSHRIVNAGGVPHVIPVYEEVP